MDRIAGEEEARRKSDPRQAVLDQLGLLVDEAEALVSLLGPMPAELIHGRPLDSTPSIADMLMSIVHRDRTVRQRNLAAFLSADPVVLEPEEEGALVQADPLDVGEILAELRTGRLRLLSVAERVAASGWDRVGELEGKAIRPLDYLGTAVQSDAVTLRQIAERIFESRPVGSPGLSRH